MVMAAFLVGIVVGIGLPVTFRRARARYRLWRYYGPPKRIEKPQPPPWPRKPQPDPDRTYDA
jgi:hypothetical protein